MLQFASLHRFVIGAGGFALLALAPLPSLAAGDPPKPTDKCSQYDEGSAEWKRCKGKKFKDDEETYSVGYWLAKTGDYAEALDVLRSARNQADPRIQTMIGFSLRKLGLVDEAMGYYAAALRADPNLTSTRQYLGEAYLHKGERAKAEEQLAEIGRRCGKTCEHYKLLAEAIAATG
jgi:tetratricopeptide (TPR) repeat protein